MSELDQFLSSHGLRHELLDCPKSILCELEVVPFLAIPAL